MDRDLAFLSREFSEYDVPKEKRYLLKYFRTPIQQEFLRYYLIFGNIENFTDHTGHYCQERWLRLLLKRMRRLEELRNEAKANADLEKLAEIESGRMKLCGV